MNVDRKMVVKLSVKWLQGMLSTCMDVKAVNFEAALCEKEDGTFYLSARRVGDEILPNFPDSDLFQERKHQSYEKAIEAGLSPVWILEDGTGVVKGDEDDDGRDMPTMYLENADFSSLKLLAASIGVKNVHDYNREELVYGLKDFFDYLVEEPGKKPKQLFKLEKSKTPDSQSPAEPDKEKAPLVDTVDPDSESKEPVSEKAAKAAPKAVKPAGDKKKLIPKEKTDEK